MLSISLKLFACQIFLLLVVGTFSQRVRFPGNDPSTGSPYVENDQEQCPRRSRCIARSRCPPSRRSRVPNDCYYEDYSRRNPGVCCVKARRRTTTTTMATPMNPSNGRYCGRSFAIAGMIGGTLAGQNVFPWMVAITTLNGIPTCTASLIDRTHVLTAAHCFDTDGPIDTTIYALRIGNVDQRLGNRYTISNLAIPNNYQKGRYYSDVAVITLDRPVNSKNFMPICLPDSTFRNFTNRGVTLAGWGSTRDGGPTSDILMQLNGASVVSNYQCNSIYGGGVSGFNSQFPSGINTSFICAGFSEDARERDSCSGDSGGPMMVFHGGRRYQIGILSFGHMKCGAPGYPAVYTRVSSSMNFILENL